MSDTTRGSGRARFGPQAVSEAMHGQDPAAQAMGISIDRVAHGLAELSMQVRPDMVDWGGHCHGGLIFSLADTAFAHACNSYNNVSLAVSCSFEYLAPARPGERLVAIAHERTRGARSGLYDVNITNAAGDLVAVFRGKSFSTGRPLIESEESST